MSTKKADSDDLLDHIRKLQSKGRWSKSLPEDLKLDLVTKLFEKILSAAGKEQTLVGDNILLSFLAKERKNVFTRSLAEFYNEYSESREQGDSTKKDFNFCETAIHKMVKKAHHEVSAIKEGEKACFFISGDDGDGSCSISHDILKSLAILDGAESTDSTGKTCNKILRTLSLGTRILDVFGSAITSQSERQFSPQYSKYVEINFEYDPNIARKKVSSSKIETFMLDTNRICNRENAESNFLVFYLLRAAANSNEFAQDAIGGEEFFYYLQSDGELDPLEGAELTDSVNFDTLIQWMKTIGISHEEIESVVRICGAVLLLGNLEFEKDEEDEIIIKKVDAEVDNEGEEQIVNLNLEQLAFIFDVHSDSLEFALIHVEEDGEEEDEPKYFQRNSIYECESVVNLLAKTLYSRMFQWLVAKINYLTSITDASGEIVAVGDKLKTSTVQIIQLSEIKRNENTCNTLNDMCTDMANEKAMEIFENEVFERERKICNAEGINADHVPNTELKHHEVSSKLLSYMCQLLNMRHVASGIEFFEDLCGKVDDQILNCIKYGEDTDELSIKQYNGIIKYKIDTLIEANEDPLPIEVHRFLMDTPNAYIEELLDISMDTLINHIADKNGELQYVQDNEWERVLGKAKRQLEFVFDKVKGSTSYFVRCLSRSKLNQDNDGIPTLALQLKNWRLVETISMRCGAYTHKIDKKEWFREYKILSKRSLSSDDNIAVLCSHLIKDIEEKEASLQGRLTIANNTIVYTAEESRLLERMRESVVIGKSVLCQAVIRRTLVRMKILRMHRIDLDIQKAINLRDATSLKKIINDNRSFDLFFGLKNVQSGLAIISSIEKELKLADRVRGIAKLQPEFSENGECTNFSHFNVIVSKMKECIDNDPGAFKGEEAQRVLRVFEKLQSSKNVLRKLTMAQRTLNKSMLLEAIECHSDLISNSDCVLPSNFGEKDVLRCKATIARLEKEEKDSVLLLKLLIGTPLICHEGKLSAKNVNIDEIVKALSNLKPNGQDPLTESAKKVHEIGTAVLQMRRRAFMTLESGDDNWNAVSNAVKQIRSMISNMEKEMSEETGMSNFVKDLTEILRLEIQLIGTQIGVQHEIDNLVDQLEIVFKECPGKTVLQKLIQDAETLNLHTHEENYYRSLYTKVKEKLHRIELAENRINDVLNAEKLSADRLAAAIQNWEMTVETKDESPIFLSAKQTFQKIKSINLRLKDGVNVLDISSIDSFLKECDGIKYSNKEIEQLRAKLQLPKEKLLQEQLRVATELKNESQKESIISTLMEEILMKPESQSQYQLQNYPGLQHPDQWNKAVKAPLINLSSEYHKGAMLVQKCIQAYIGERKAMKPLVEIGMELLKIGIQTKELRDEIYIQLANYITLSKTRDDVAYAYAWNLMELVCMSYPPTIPLLYYIRVFFNTTGHDSTLHLDLLAKACKEEAKIPSNKIIEDTLQKVAKVRRNTRRSITRSIRRKRISFSTSAISA